MKKLLVLGGSEKTRPLINYAKGKGHYVLLCDRNPTNACSELVDAFIQVNTVDYDRVVQALGSHEPDGVVSFGSDVNAVSAAHIAERLGLPGNPPESVLTMVHKDCFRAFLTAHGFATPRSASFSSLAESSPDEWGFGPPVIVKPIDGAGSAGVTRLDHWSGLKAALAHALGASRTGRVIVEEFIERRHPHMIGGDVFVVDGEVRFWGLLNSHRGCPTAPFLPTGTSFPVTLEDGDRHEVLATTQRLVSALGIRLGGLNVELMFDDAGRLFVVELAPRNGGNQIPELLQLATGVDLIEALVDAALGDQVRLRPDTKTAFVANYMLHANRNGRFFKLALADSVEPFVVDQVLSVKPGDSIRAFGKATDSFGVLSLRFSCAKEQQALLSRIAELVTLELEPPDICKVTGVLKGWN